jgi:phage RecT family recombinase
MANVSEKLSLVQKLNDTPATNIVGLPEVEERFKKLYEIIHPGAKGSVFYEAEKFHFAKLIKEKPDLAACSKLSLYGCFLDAAVSGLSFDPSFKHLYVVSFNSNVGTKQAPQWEKRAQIIIGGQGELLLRMMQGQIKYVDNPVLVYEGDEFSFGNRGGSMVVDHIANMSKRTEKIIAGYLKITRNDGSTDFKVLTAADMDRFRKFSRDPNSKAWTEGFAGMFEAKLIKHAFKNYPKVRTGENTALATETADEEVEIIPSHNATISKVPAQIDYGTDDESFADPEPKPASKTVTVDDDSF